jgi:hypothetical protein
VNPPQLFPLPNPAQFASALAPAFPDLATVMVPAAGAGDQDQYGAPHGPTERVYTILPDHQDLQCAVAPEGGTTAAASKERRTVDFVQEWNLFEIILNGYYPLITQVCQIVVDSKTYEIQGVNWDVYKILTHVHCRVLTL